MSDDSLIEAMPDFVAFLGRDGVVLRHLGGRHLGIRSADQPLAGRRPEEIWDDETGARIRQLVRRALASRGSESLNFCQHDRSFEARITAHGRERVICVIRESTSTAVEGEREGVRSGAVERRAFFALLSNEIADATLRERRLALCVVHVDGVNDIGGIIDYAVGQQVMDSLLARLEPPGTAHGDAATWRAARIGEGVVGLIVRDFDERGALRDLALGFVQRLRQPIAIGDAHFSVRPAIGIAVLGDDASQTKPLLDHAQTAMLEARRSEDGGVHFYSDTLKLRSLARLDFQRELRDAIAGDAFALRYAARCDLSTGHLAAIAAYLRWPSELRHDIKPSEFLPVAESTGLALDLSRWALRRLRRDAHALRKLGDDDLRISFGALRQHFASEALLDDVREWIGSGEIKPAQLELRLPERVLAGISSPGRVLRPFAEMGIRLVVDEFGRGVSSLTRLARMPLWGLQIDRGLAVAAREDAIARRAANAALALATTLGLVPIVSGIDTADDLQRWQSHGASQGLGDHFVSALRSESQSSPEPLVPARTRRSRR
ncbi:MAG: EAL domain-containing protein [Steroidobacteraceae bacterium]